MHNKYRDTATGVAGAEAHARARSSRPIRSASRPAQLPAALGLLGPGQLVAAVAPWSGAAGAAQGGRRGAEGPSRQRPARRWSLVAAAQTAAARRVPARRRRAAQLDRMQPKQPPPPRGRHSCSLSRAGRCPGPGEGWVGWVGWVGWGVAVPGGVGSVPRLG